MLWSKRIVLIFLLFLFGCHAHIDGFQHLKGDTGPSVGTEPCMPGSMWHIDLDHDGVVDICRLMYFEHGRLHYQDFEPLDNKRDPCPCWIILEQKNE